MTLGLYLRIDTKFEGQYQGILEREASDGEFLSIKARKNVSAHYILISMQNPVKITVCKNGCNFCPNLSTFVPPPIKKARQNAGLSILFLLDLRL